MRPANMTPGKRRNSIQKMFLNIFIVRLESVRPICLPTLRPLHEQLPKRVSISGWGVTESRELHGFFLP